MFLNKIISKNPKLIETSVMLHQEGKIPSNSYVLDIDTISKNALLMANKGKEYNLKVFAMTKQIGRNPIAIKALMKSGIKAGVCVDMNDARPMHAAGMEIGHLGHLVQVPSHETKAGISMKPLYWTVFNMEKAKEISDHLPAGQEQKVMARVYMDGDTFYKGHEGGFPIGSIVQVARDLESLHEIKFAGLTTFPTQLFVDERCSVEHTHNYLTILKAAEELKKAGFKDIEINAPGTTSSMLFEEMASKGVTQVEPGHGLTGTTPIHAFKDLAEEPALVYVSEVSHFYSGRPYCFGGGMYIDPVFPAYDVKACVSSEPSDVIKQIISCDIPNPAAIDYYGILKPEPEQKVNVGDTVVFGFRAQIFVTRAYVVPVSGISLGQPVVEGIFTSDGREVRWPEW